MFARNRAVSGESLAFGGGAIYSDDAAPLFQNCTFYGHSTVDRGAVVYTRGAQAPTFQESILAFNDAGEAVYCYLDATPPTFLCCDLYANEFADWTNCLVAQLGTGGNISADPQFCVERRATSD